MVKKLIRSIYYNIPRLIFGGKAFPCRNFVMELTYRCNLSCRMCSIMNEIKAREDIRNERELYKDEVIKIIAQLPSKSNITLTGGELFLKKGIDAILKKAAERHNITLATNGVLLEKYSDLLVEYQVQSIGISVDGPPDVHDHIRNLKGGFEKLEKGLYALTETKYRLGRLFPKININSVILKESYSTLPEVVKLAKELGVNSCTFQIYDPSLSRSGLSLEKDIDLNENPLNRLRKIDPVSLRQTLEHLLHEGERLGIRISFLPSLTIDEIVQFYQREFNLKNWRCLLPWSTMRVSPYGDIYPCLNYYIGNVRDNKSKILWNNGRYVKFRRLLQKEILFNACIGCCKMVPINRFKGT